MSGVRKFLRSSVPSPCEHFSECLKEGLSNRSSGCPLTSAIPGLSSITPIPGEVGTRALEGSSRDPGEHVALGWGLVNQLRSLL